MEPLVSCILPTKNRAEFIPQAIRSYQSQTYPHRELVIVDNGDDQTAMLLPPDRSIRYAKVTGTLTTGDMRNLCAKYARGEFICHFDSDDWSAPERVADQVTRLSQFGVVTGYHSAFFYDVRDGKCYQWHMPHSAVRYVLGTSLCYRKSWWSSHPFHSLRVGEDLKFFQQAQRDACRFVSTAPANQMIVARVHEDQTCRKTLNRNSYTPMPQTALPKAFPREIQSYK